MYFSFGILLIVSTTFTCVWVLPLFNLPATCFYLNISLIHITILTKVYLDVKTNVLKVIIKKN